MVQIRSKPPVKCVLQNRKNSSDSEANLNESCRVGTTQADLQILIRGNSQETLHRALRLNALITYCLSVKYIIQ
jgi:hypothetical protein